MLNDLCVMYASSVFDHNIITCGDDIVCLRTDSIAPKIVGRCILKQRAANASLLFVGARFDAQHAWWTIADTAAVDVFCYTIILLLVTYKKSYA